MAQLAQQAAHPRRVHPGLQRYPAAWHRGEDSLHRLRSRAQLLLTKDFASFVQYAIPAGAITKVQTDGQLPLEILVARCCHSATLSHCWSPLSLALRARR